MFRLWAEKNDLSALAGEDVTSGSANVYRVQFGFGKGWSGMVKTAVFKAGVTSVSVLLDESGECTIPYEVLVEPNKTLYAGIYGTRDGIVVLPTVWANLGQIKPGTTLGRAAGPPTPSLYEQLTAELQNRADRLEYDGENLSLLSGDKKLSSVTIKGGEGGGGIRFATDEEVAQVLNAIFGKE